MAKPLLKFVAELGAALLLTALIVGCASAESWWDGKWQLRKKITFDTTESGANIQENLAQTPVLVRLHSGNFAFDSAKGDGSDIRFVASDDKTPLKYHVEKYNPKQGIALFWVRVPQIAGKSTQDHVWLYYGNDGAQAAADTGGTFDTGQSVVFHFGEKDGAPRDATAYGNHGASFSGKLEVPALIGNGAAFAGGNDRLVINRSPSLNFSKGFTFSTWLKPGAAQGSARLFSWDDGKQAIVVGLEQGAAYARVGAAVTGKTAPLAAGAWQHLAVTAEPGKKLIVYLNGREAAAVPLTTIPSPAAELAIANALAGGSGFVGELDEVQVAATVRQSGWVSASFAGQGPDGKFLSVLEEESGAGEEGHTMQMMRIIANSVTVDGWLIIGLCTGMLAWATLVFVQKSRELRTIRSGNRLFLQQFNDLHDPLDLDISQEDLEDSTLFRIYRAGHTQIMGWAEKHGSDKKDVALPSTAINIFRAAMERASSDETRKLNAWMIILTLSISGGPFWGLLGTVWGVMNTFAGLAASGEANLSAIAPGVASALACTLFGLFVAIPALFAYSILATQMKNLNADTRHFIEEFYLRVEGFHGEE
jgi:biopolymer transport protein ExbB